MMEAQWGMAPVAPPPPTYEPVTDPMYAPAPELSYQAPYVPPAPDPGYGAGSPIYPPSAEAMNPSPAYGPPAPEQPFMQDPWMQMAYRPAPYLNNSGAILPGSLDSWESPANFTENEAFSTINGQDIGGGPPPWEPVPAPVPGFYDPSMDQQFGWNGTGDPNVRNLTAQQNWLPFDQQEKALGVAYPGYFGQPRFNNPQFTTSNAQFDATTDPNNPNRYGVGINQMMNTELPFLTEASNAARDAGAFLGGQVDKRFMTGGYGEKTGRFVGDSIIPNTFAEMGMTLLGGDLAPGSKLLTGAGRMAEEGFGGALLGSNLDTIGKTALDKLPNKVIQGAARRFAESPGVGPDIAHLVREAGGGAANEASDFLKEVMRSNPGQVADDIAAKLAAGVPEDQIVRDLPIIHRPVSAPKLSDEGAALRAAEEARQQPFRDAAAAKQAAAEDAAGLAVRTPAQIAETVARTAPTEGMQQIPEDVSAAIARGANGGRAATVADELGAVAEGPGEQALNAALKRAEKMPLNADTLLGVSELSDESKGIVAEYIRNTKALTAGQTQDVSRLRNIATKITGNIDNRVASEYARQEDALYREVINSEAKLVDQINKAAGKVVTEGMSEADLAELEALRLAHIESIYRKATEATQVLRQSLKESLDFKGQQVLNDALKSYDAERIKAAQSFFKKLADVQQPLKEMVLGGDISTIFQQGLRGARVGTWPAITGGLGRTANLVAKTLGGEGDLFGVYMKNGLTPVQQMRADGVRMGAESVDISRNRLPTPNEKGILAKINPAWKAYQKWNDQQFKAVDKFKQLVYEGRLMQEKAMGRDITDPKIRRAIADFVNTAGSTSSRATAPMRGEADRAFFLTSAMTRAQANEGLQVLKAFTSRTEAANFLNQALSTATVIGLAWQVQKQFGPDISLEDFISQSFDPNNPKMFGRLLVSAGGKTYVNSFLPQTSLASTFVKTFADQNNLKKVAEDWAKFGFGRQNIGLTTAENLGGFGYGKNGQFFWGDMPNDQRLKEAIPAPLTAKALMDTQDPYLIAAQATGELAYTEQSYSAADRASRDAYGMPFNDIPPDAKAAINKQLREAGTQLSDEDLAAPYNYAVSSALKQRIRQMEKDPEAAAVEDKFLEGLGLQDFKIEKYRTETKAEEAFVKLAMEEKSVSKRQAEAAWEDYKNMLQLDRLTNQMRTETLNTDPEVAKALIRIWENGDTQYKPKAEVWKAAGMEAPK